MVKRNGVHDPAGCQNQRRPRTSPSAAAEQCMLLGRSADSSSPAELLASLQAMGMGLGTKMIKWL